MKIDPPFELDPNVKVRTRFAPSPTGYLHVGGARTALYSWLFAKHNNGEFVLRIEDTDLERSTPEATAAIIEGMEWLNLAWEHGPYYQTKRFDRYNQVIDEMIEQGLAYRCYCSKERLEELRHTQEQNKEKPRYDRHCLHDHNHAADEPHVVRFKNPTEGSVVFDDAVRGRIEISNSELDDLIIRRTDGSPTYNFCVVVDDWDMGITHVVRGNEYLASTPKYNLLYDAYGWDRPTYIHLPPVMKDEHAKLSKRNGDASYQDLTKQGYLKDAILNYIALLGWSPADEEILSLDDLIEQFNIEHISKAPAIFDIDKLKWMNGVYLRNMSLEEFHKVASPYYDFITIPVNTLEISKALQPRVERLADIPELMDFINETLPFDASIYKHKKMKTNPENSLEALELSLPELEKWEDYNDDEGLMNMMMDIAKSHELKNGRIMWPIRVALSNKAFTPGGAVEIAHILGKEETLRRINKGIELLEK